MRVLHRVLVVSLVVQLTPSVRDVLLARHLGAASGMVVWVLQICHRSGIVLCLADLPGAKRRLAIEDVDVHPASNNGTKASWELKRNGVEVACVAHFAMSSSRCSQASTGISPEKDRDFGSLLVMPHPYKVATVAGQTMQNIHLHHENTGVSEQAPSHFSRLHISHIVKPTSRCSTRPIGSTITNDSRILTKTLTTSRQCQHTSTESHPYLTG